MPETQKGSPNGLPEERITHQQRVEAVGGTHALSTCKAGWNIIPSDV